MFAIIFDAVRFIARIVLGLLILSLALTAPGAMKYRRYTRYESMDKVLVAESDKVHSVVDCIVYGKKYSIVIMDRCRLLASGPAMLVYNQDGKLIDKTRDEGDDGRFQKIWRKHMNIARKHGL